MKFIVVLIAGLIILWAINLIRAVSVGKTDPPNPKPNGKLARLLRINKEIK